MKHKKSNPTQIYIAPYITRESEVLTSATLRAVCSHLKLRGRAPRIHLSRTQRYVHVE